MKVDGLREARRSFEGSAEHFRQGRWGEAIQGCEAFLQHAPSHIGARLRLSQALLKSGRYNAARATVTDRAAVATTPAEALALAKALRYFEEHAATVRVLGPLLEQGLPAELGLEATAQCIAVGAHDLALRFSDAGRAQGRRDPRWLYQRGVLDSFFGRYDASERSLNDCIALHPRYAQAHWMLARLERIGPTSHHVDRLKRELTRAEPASEAATYLALALHYELHLLGRFDEAWAALASTFGPKAWLGGWGYARQEERFAALESWHPPPASQGASGAFRPVFIVGMHRSGTSLLERILAGHAAVTDAGESYAFPAALRAAADHYTPEAVDVEIVRRSPGFDFSDVGRRYLESNTWRLGGHGVLTEKLPHNFLNLGFAATALADARFIHVARDPVDTCFSNLRTFFRQIGAYTYDPVQIARFFADERRLLARWQQLFPGRILEVDYAELVARPDVEARRVMEFCGLPFEPGALDVGRSGGATATASSAQVRGAVSTRRMGAWRPYEAYLAPMLAELARLECIGGEK